MALFPPEQPMPPAENAQPLPPSPVEDSQPQSAEEPRLLLRRDVEEEPAAPQHIRWRAPQVAERRPREPRERVSDRRWRVVGASVLGLLALVCVGVLVGVLWLRHVMARALPQLDGTVHAAGLSAPVTVTRDAQGVPSIHATSLDDLVFAQGYVTAQDRMWQMDALRRHAAGELAEVLGSRLVDHDRQQRYLQLRHAADRSLAALPSDQRELFEAYARGVNAFLDSHHNALPVEFSLLHYTPPPWQPRDSMLVMFAMWQDLTTSFPRKLDREILSAHLPPALLSDLYPATTFRDRPPTQPREDLTTPKPFVLQIPLDSTQSSLHAPEMPSASPAAVLERARALTPEGDCAECRAGSNNWVVAGTRTASGAPLLSNDMHLGLSLPGIWYEAALHVNGAQPLDVEGFTLPGTPLVVSGRNAHVAWGYTNLGADVQDLYIEHLRGEGDHTEFQRTDGTWQAAEHHEEVIRVRGGLNVSVDVMSTTHAVGSTVISTPIVSPLFKGEHRALSLAWTLYDPTATQLPFLAVDSAASGNDLVAAFAHFGGPSLNLVWADDAHHIGYHALGNVPVRGTFDHHPRVAAPMEVPPTANPGAPMPDENPDDPENNTESQALIAQPFDSPLMQASFSPAMMRPRLIAAGFARPVRHRAARVRPMVKPGAPARKKKPAPQQEAQAPVVPMPPPPPAIDYTIGAAIPDVPVDALNPAAQWAGYIPYDQLPAVIDPPSGVLATANARITANDYPYSVSDDWADGYRVERIYRLLENRTALTGADMLATQMDVYSPLGVFLAQRLAYAIDHASAGSMGSDAARLHQAADILRRWDGNMSVDAAAPSIVNAFRRSFWTSLLAQQICVHDHLKPNDAHARTIARLYLWGTSASAMEALINHQPQRWLPPGYANWDDFLAASLAQSLRGVPHDLAKWTYGSQHHLELKHPVLSRPLFGRMLGTRLDPGPQPIAGDELTVRTTTRAFGASERFTADMASPDATIANITAGESGNPVSPWYLDQFQPWLRGRTFQLPLDAPAGDHTLTLAP